MRLFYVMSRTERSRREAASHAWRNARTHTHNTTQHVCAHARRGTGASAACPAHTVANTHTPPTQAHWCVSVKLKTHLGSATQTFASLEQTAAAIVRAAARANAATAAAPATPQRPVAGAGQGTPPELLALLAALTGGVGGVAEMVGAPADAGAKSQGACEGDVALACGRGGCSAMWAAS